MWDGGGIFKDVTDETDLTDGIDLIESAVVRKTIVLIPGCVTFELLPRQ